MGSKAESCESPRIRNENNYISFQKKIITGKQVNSKEKIEKICKKQVSPLIWLIKDRFWDKIESKIR